MTEDICALACASVVEELFASSLCCCFISHDPLSSPQESQFSSSVINVMLCVTQSNCNYTKQLFSFSSIEEKQYVLRRTPLREMRTQQDQQQSKVKKVPKLATTKISHSGNEEAPVVLFFSFEIEERMRSQTSFAEQIKKRA